MANRKKIDNVITHKEKTVNGTSYVIVPEESPDDKYFITTQGDRLDLLAQQFYGNQHLWFYIAKVNGINTITVDPGTKIRIPKTFPGIK